MPLSLSSQTSPAKSPCPVSLFPLCLCLLHSRLYTRQDPEEKASLLLTLHLVLGHPQGSLRLVRVQIGSCNVCVIIPGAETRDSERDSHPWSFLLDNCYPSRAVLLPHPHCCSQQLLQLTYLGGSFACCLPASLVEMLGTLRPATQLQGCHPPPNILLCLLTHPTGNLYSVPSQTVDFAKIKLKTKCDQIL